MTTYFITGGLGFLGQYIVQAVHGHDPAAELRVLVRTRRRTHLQVEALDRIHWVQGELTDPASFAGQLAGVDTVIHNAALVSFDPADAEAVIRSNVEGTRNLLQAALQAGCRNFIFISSISAMDYRPPITDESMVPDLEWKRRKDVYGYSKLVSEAELQAVKDQMRVIILNPSVILGPGSQESNRIAATLRYLPVVPMMSYINSFVDVRDVARAVVLALTRGESGERYIVTGTNINMLEFVRTVMKVMKKQAWVLPLSRSSLGWADAVLSGLRRLGLVPGVRPLAEMNVDKPCSTEKIRQAMGWEPAYSLEESIRDALEFARSTQ